MKLNFSIHGDYITDLLRDLWAERSFVKCFEVFDTLIGLSQDQKIAIIEGRMKLVGVNDLTLEEDTWTPNEGDEYYSFQEALKYGESGKPEDVDGEFVWESNRRVWAWVENGEVRYRTEFKEFQPDDWEESLTLNLREPSLPMVTWTPRNLPDIDDMTFESDHERRLEIQNRMAVSIDDYPIERGANLPAEPVDNVDSPSAWVCPRGRYYPCANMEHVGLAGNIVEKFWPDYDGDAEAHLEDRGWMKIAKTMYGFHVMCNRFTKSQAAKLFDYCQHHNRDYDAIVKKFDLGTND
jgi:hypothetical protein